MPGAIYTGLMILLGVMLFIILSDRLLTAFGL